MKIAITGNTSGIGKALANVYSTEHTVIGFSRYTGYDISKETDRKKIIAESADCDVFINNAYHDFSQCDLLFDLWQQWKDQKKQIVNISSSITMRWQNDFRLLKYRSAKIALEESSDFLWNKSSWPAIVCISPTMTDTPKTTYYTGINKVNVDEFAKLVYNTIHQPNFRIQKLSLAVNPLN